MPRRATKLLILIADQSVRRAAAILASQSVGNVEVHEAADAVALAEMLAAGPFDHVLLDESLAWARAENVLAMLRRRSPATTVVILSVDPTVESFREWVRKGARDVIPASIAGLVDDLPQALQSSVSEPQPVAPAPVSPVAPPPQTAPDKPLFGVEQRSATPTVESGIGSFLLSGDGRILETDKVFPGLFGYDSAERMKGMRLQSLCDAQSEPALRELTSPTSPSPRSIRAVFLDVAGKPVSLGLRRTSLRGDGAGRIRGIAWCDPGASPASPPPPAQPRAEKSASGLAEYAHLVAHEVRTPVENLRRIARLIMMEHKRQLGTDGEELLEQLMSGANDASRIVGELLTMAELDGTEKIRTQPHDLSHIVDDVLGELESVVQESGAEISLQGNASVLGEGTALRLLFRNLIENSIKFRGDRPPRIGIGAERVGDAWRIAVSDDGIGIPQADRERILKPFVRLHPRNRYPGTGLGLSLCEKIVRLHGSELEIGDGDGGGTVVSFHLPSADTLPAEHARDAAAEHAGEPSFET